MPCRHCAPRSLATPAAHARRDDPEQHVRHPLPQRHAPLSAVVQQRRDEQRRIIRRRCRAHPAEHFDAVLLVAEHHRFEDAALRLVEVAVRVCPFVRRDVRPQRPEELPHAVRSPRHQPMPVTNRRIGPATGTMMSCSG